MQSLKSIRKETVDFCSAQSSGITAPSDEQSGILRLLGVKLCHTAELEKASIPLVTVAKTVASYLEVASGVVGNALSRSAVPSFKANAFKKYPSI